MSRIFTARALAAAATLTLLGGIAHAKDVELLNVSYDPTRELYEEYNKSFARVLAEEDRRQGHRQAVAWRLGQAGALGDRRLQADVVTLALAADIDAIATNAKLLPANWASRLAAQQLALHVDHRVPGAQGQSQGHQGLG